MAFFFALSYWCMRMRYCGLSVCSCVRHVPVPLFFFLFAIGRISCTLDGCCILVGLYFLLSGQRLLAQRGIASWLQGSFSFHDSILWWPCNFRAIKVLVGETLLKRDISWWWWFWFWATNIYIYSNWNRPILLFLPLLWRGLDVSSVARVSFQAMPFVSEGAVMILCMMYHLYVSVSHSSPEITPTMRSCRAFQSLLALPTFIFTPMGFLL